MDRVVFTEEKLNLRSEGFKLDSTETFVESDKRECRVQTLIRHYASYPLHTVWKKTDKKFYVNNLGAVAYEECGNILVVAGDPLVLSEGDEHELFENFVDAFPDKTICGYYFSEYFVDKLYGFKSHVAGVSRVLDFSKYDINGYESRDVRRALNQGRRVGLEFVQIPESEKSLFLSDLKRKENKWFSGKKGPRIKFLLSEIQAEYPGSNQENWYLVRGESGIEAFVSCLNYEVGGHSCIYVDNLLQFRGGHKFALDFLLSQLITKFKQQGIARLNLGFNAFQKTQPDSGVGLGLWLNQVFEPVYEARGLYMFKRKFTNREVPRYLILQEGTSKIKQLVAMAKVTFAKNH